MLITVSFYKWVFGIPCLKPYSTIQVWYFRTHWRIFLSRRLRAISSGSVPKAARVFARELHLHLILKSQCARRGETLNYFAPGDLRHRFVLGPTNGFYRAREERSLMGTSLESYQTKDKPYFQKWGNWNNISQIDKQNWNKSKNKKKLYIIKTNWKTNTKLFSNNTQ